MTPSNHNKKSITRSTTPRRTHNDLGSCPSACGFIYHSHKFHHLFASSSVYLSPHNDGFIITSGHVLIHVDLHTRAMSSITSFTCLFQYLFLFIWCSVFATPQHAHNDLRSCRCAYGHTYHSHKFHHLFVSSHT